VNVEGGIPGTALDLKKKKKKIRSRSI